MLESFIPTLVVVLIFVLLFSFFFRKSKKTDKGFQFLYYKLTYRRRMIRTLYMLPIAALFVWFTFSIAPWSQTEKVLYTLIIAVVFLFQLGYNYYKWKKEESDTQQG